jgi:hypothetical protein
VTGRADDEDTTPELRHAPRPAGAAGIVPLPAARRPERAGAGGYRDRIARRARPARADRSGVDRPGRVPVRRDRDRRPPDRGTWLPHRRREAHRADARRPGPRRRPSRLPARRGPRLGRGARGARERQPAVPAGAVRARPAVGAAPGLHSPLVRIGGPPARPVARCRRTTGPAVWPHARPLRSCGADRRPLGATRRRCVLPAGRVGPRRPPGVGARHPAGRRQRPPPCEPGRTPPPRPRPRRRGHDVRLPRLHRVPPRPGAGERSRVEGV